MRSRSAGKGTRMQDKLREIELLASSPNGGDRCKAVERLAELSRAPESKEEPRCFELLKARGEDSKYEVRQAFAEQCILLPDDWLWRLLPPLLDDPNPFVRRSALRVRKQRGSGSEEVEDVSTDRRMTIDVLAARIEAAADMDPAKFRNTVVSALRDAQGIKIIEFAHELKNLLHPLSSAVGRLRDGMSPHTLKKHAETLNQISARAKRVDEFGDAMKFIAEGRDLRFDSIQCEKVVDLAVQSVTDLAKEREVRLLVRDIYEGNVRVIVERLTRALGNILRNAIEVSPKRGQVEFTTRHFKDSGEVEFVIRDEGTGIKQEARRTIFDALVSGKREKRDGEHMGMGLFVAHSVIVVEHKGTIDVDSDGASWTVFKARIPVRAGSM